MFLEEIRLSKKLGNHPNIVGIVGSIIVYQPYCLILEYVDGGDILDFLQKNKEKNEAQISQEDQVFFAWQIANGMVIYITTLGEESEIISRIWLVVSLSQNGKHSDSFPRNLTSVISIRNFI